MIRYSVFFCDDIRLENNGKHLLIGVYSGDLVPFAASGKIKLAALVRVQGLSTQRHFHLRLLSPDGTVAIEVEDDLHYESGADGLPIAVVNAPVTSLPGDVVAEISFDDGPPEIAGTLRILPPDDDDIDS